MVLESVGLAKEGIINVIDIDLIKTIILFNNYMYGKKIINNTSLSK